MSIVLSQWRLIAEVIVATVLLVGVWGYRNEAHQLETELEHTNALLREANSRLEALHAQSQALMDSMWNAQKQAEKVRIVYQDRIVKVQAEPIPATCEGAVSWAIENKNDLAW